MWFLVRQVLEGESPIIAHAKIRIRGSGKPIAVGTDNDFITRYLSPFCPSLPPARRPPYRRNLYVLQRAYWILDIKMVQKRVLVSFGVDVDAVAGCEHQSSSQKILTESSDGWAEY